MTYILYFLVWTLMLYWIHRFSHSSKFMMKFHGLHHGFINRNLQNGKVARWHWSNLFLFNDNWTSTIDLWLTEVIPTVIMSAITGQWWLFIFYYVWAAFIQEPIEHNPKFNLPFFLSGKKHLIHHKNTQVNYGLFFPIWDKLFQTYAGTKYFNPT